MNWRLVLIVGLMVSPCASAWAGELVSYSSQVQPIFDQNCVVCHAKGMESGGLNLTAKHSYKSLVSVKSSEAPLDRVAPGDVQNSYLIHKLDGTFIQVGGNGDPMPKSDIPMNLASSDVALIAQWIAEGAPKN